MKVSTVETLVLRAQPAQTYWGARAWRAGLDVPTGQYPPLERRRYLYSDTIDAVLVRIEAADGTVGWGEAKAPVGARATAAIIDDLLAPLVIGTGLDEISNTWDRMYAGMRVRGHDSGFWLEAIAGIDIALWDALGRHCGQALTTLIGGRYRDEVPVYASGIPGAQAGSGASGQAQVRDEAQRMRDSGFTAVKVAIGAGREDDIASVETVRDAMGAMATILVDAAGQYDLPDALRVGHALVDAGVGFFEMPLPPEDIGGYARLARRVDVPLALDSVCTRHRALEFLRAGALHVLQPDVCRAGGITESMRIAQLADAFGAQATPHVSIGSAVHIAASISCAAAIPNFSILEEWTGSNPLREIAADCPEVVDGRYAVPTKAGLGISVDQAVVRRMAA